MTATTASTATPTSHDHDHDHGEWNDCRSVCSRRWAGSADTCGVLSFKKLDVYRRSIELLALGAIVLEDFSRSKGSAVIADQLKRAAFSIPLNIAEGAGKSTHADQSRHYIIARGSAMEYGAIFDAALVLDLVTEETAAKADRLVTALVEMLTKMCRFGRSSNA